jgi:hypothetical protein
MRIRSVGSRGPFIAGNVGISLFLTDVARVKENYRQFTP